MGNFDPKSIRNGRAWYEQVNKPGFMPPAKPSVALRLPLPNHPDKGKEGGRCNRVACQAPGAFYRNSETRAYYCWSCASAINKHPLTNGERLFGILARDPREESQPLVGGYSFTFEDK